MTDADGRRLLVPLRSNASQLLAGAPVEAVRRKLKFASVVYDELLIEGGSLTIQAGEGGSFTFPTPETDFQTTAQRRAGMGSGFYVTLGAPDAPDIPAPTNRVHAMLASRTASISWRPTFLPFAEELPANCGWVTWVHFPRDAEVAGLASSWSYRDGNNDALLSAVPVLFARSLIIDHANSDLARAALSGVALLQDATHRQVVMARLDSTTTWRPVGFAVPVLAPHVGNLPWGEIAAVRSTRAMRSYRGMLQELEAEALQESAEGSDVERVVHVLLQKRLAALAEVPRGAPSALFNAVASFFVGAGIGAATTGWTSPAAIWGGAALGTVVDVGRQAVGHVRARAARNWVAVHQRLAG